jgi:hypothetical protein
MIMFMDKSSPRRAGKSKDYPVSGIVASILLLSLCTVLVTN